jgi:hypothetical protein
MMYIASGNHAHYRFAHPRPPTVFITNDVSSILGCAQRPVLYSCCAVKLYVHSHASTISTSCRKEPLLEHLAPGR